MTQLGDQKDCHYRALHPPWRRDFNKSIQELSHLLVHLGRKEYSIYYPRSKTQIIPPTVVALLFISVKKSDQFSVRIHSFLVWVPTIRIGSEWMHKGSNTNTQTKTNGSPGKPLGMMVGRLLPFLGGSPFLGAL